MFGSNDVTSVWDLLGVSSFSGIPVASLIKVPSGKTFKLWALGQGACAHPWSSNIMAYDENAGQPVHELGLGVEYDFYPTPYTVVGFAIVSLQGCQTGSPSAQTVSGYMVFSIE